MNVLLTRMLSKADPSQVPGLSRFFKTGPGQYGEGDKFLGIKVPVTRAVVKECWRSVSFQDLEECITSPYHEVRLAALLALVEVFSHAGKRPPIRSGVTLWLSLPPSTFPQLARQMGLSHLWTMVSKMWPCSMKEPRGLLSACSCGTRS